MVVVVVEFSWKGEKKWLSCVIDLVRSSSLESHLLERDSVGLEFSLRLLGELVAFGVVGGGALYRAEAAVRARGSEGLAGLLSCRREVGCPLREVGLRERGPAVRLGGAEVVGGRQVELVGLSGRRRERRSVKRARSA